MRLTPPIVATKLWVTNKPRVTATQLRVEVRGLVAAIHDAIEVVHATCVSTGRALPAGEDLLREIRKVSESNLVAFTLKATRPLLAEIYCHCIRGRGWDRGWWANDDSLPAVGAHILLGDIEEEANNDFLAKMNSIANLIFAVSAEIDNTAMLRLDTIRQSTQEPSITFFRSRVKVMTTLSQADISGSHGLLRELWVKLYAVASNALSSGGRNPVTIKQEFECMLAEADLPKWISTDLFVAEYNPCVLSVFETLHAGSGERIDPRRILLELRAAVIEGDGHGSVPRGSPAGTHPVEKTYFLHLPSQPPSDLMNECFPPDQRPTVGLLWQHVLGNYKAAICDAALPAIESEVRQLEADLAQAHGEAHAALDRIVSAVDSEDNMYSAYIDDAMMRECIACEVRCVGGLRRADENRDFLIGTKQNISIELGRLNEEISGLGLDDDSVSRLREEIPELFHAVVSSRLDNGNRTHSVSSGKARVSTTVIYPAASGTEPQRSRRTAQSGSIESHHRLRTSKVDPAWVPISGDTPAARAGTEATSVGHGRLGTMRVDPAWVPLSSDSPQPDPNGQAIRARSGYLGKIEHLIGTFHRKMVLVSTKAAEQGKAPPVGIFMHRAVGSDAKTTDDPAPTLPLLAELVACHLTRRGLQKGIDHATMGVMLSVPGNAIEIPEAVLDALLSDREGLTRELEDIGKIIFSVDEDSLGNLAAFKRLAMARNVHGDRWLLEFRSRGALG